MLNTVKETKCMNWAQCPEETVSYPLLFYCIVLKM